MPIAMCGHLLRSLHHIVKYSKFDVPYKGKYIVYCVEKYVSVPSEGYFILLCNSTFKKHCPIRKYVPPFTLLTRRQTKKMGEGNRFS